MVSCGHKYPLILHSSQPGPSDAFSMSRRFIMLQQQTRTPATFLAFLNPPKPRPNDLLAGTQFHRTSLRIGRNHVSISAISLAPDG